MATGKKSLTDPPTNLKEAIDWVIKINGHAQDLAKELKELLKHDGSEVAMKVLDKYRLVSESVIKGLEEANLKIQAPKNRFHFAYTALNNLSQGLKPFHPQSEANINSAGVVKVKEWVSSVDESNLQKLIKELATSLEAFVKPTSGILQNSDTSSYNSANSWNNLTPSDKRDCALILLGIMPVVYIGITYLYWQCTPVLNSSSSNELWQNQKLDGSGSDQGSLKQYMEALGYTENLNNKNGQNIVSLMKSMFSGELQTHKSTASSKSYPEFLKALQDKALKPTLSTTSPLTSLYLLSYYYITNFLYTVETSSPATPSFLGYSGLTALAGGAYGFNLGGIGTLMSALLA
ncbi:variant erythrocyte surface antigen-1 family protein [Babesia caballi]|uniref:Variant erythrocyte surface antigen-1 family protein n=1 Tax=Babesia caballi TaxID=5871 RepID=A0AAV4M3P2_BABCB|nr:variant erythrocyte surface antigen-1 family protein [Babesia caballi]